MNVVTFLPPAKATHLGGSRVRRPVRRRHRSKRQTRHDQVIVPGLSNPVACARQRNGWVSTLVGIRRPWAVLAGGSGYLPMQTAPALVRCSDAIG